MSVAPLGRAVGAEPVGDGVARRTEALARALRDRNPAWTHALDPAEICSCTSTRHCPVSWPDCAVKTATVLSLGTSPVTLVQAARRGIGACVPSSRVRTGGPGLASQRRLRAGKEQRIEGRIGLGRAGRPSPRVWGRPN